jgi:hypothetical protein
VGKVAIDDFERGAAMSRVNTGVNNKFRGGEVFIPMLLLMIDVEA